MWIMSKGQTWHEMWTKGVIVFVSVQLTMRKNIENLNWTESNKYFKKCIYIWNGALLNLYFDLVSIQLFDNAIGIFCLPLNDRPTQSSMLATLPLTNLYNWDNHALVRQLSFSGTNNLSVGLNILFQFQTLLKK